MKTCKLLICTLLALLFMSGIVFAITFPNQQVSLSWSENKKYSDAVFGTWKQFAAQNANSSAEPMHACAQIFNGSIWINDTYSSTKVAKGSFVDNVTTSTTQYPVSWRLMIEPYISTYGCYGYGWIWLAQ